jgi:DNA polymerase-3 subunit epsilon
MTPLELPLDDARFIVCDVETTGGTGVANRIIEIAYLIVERGEIVERYSSLVNPRQPIPEFIRLMTGITDEMVADAPDEDMAIAAIARELRNERSVFVAHNVGFDWSFVSNTMIRAGEDFGEVARMCTCRLSRRLSTGLKRHDLGSVAEHYAVPIKERHRAMGDAEATAHAMLRMIEIARETHEAQILGDLLGLQHTVRTSPRIETKARERLAPVLAEIPDEPGVYYFLNAKGTVLYVGKAKSLTKRVHTYFSGQPLHGRSVSKMIKNIRGIRWETTGTELGALLLESREIKTLRPPHNVASTEYHAPAFLHITNEDFPRLELVHEITDDGDYFGPFRSSRTAERIRDLMMRRNHLRSCTDVLKPHPEARPCFDYHVKRCHAPCALLQTKTEYQQSVRQAREFLSHVESGAIGELRAQMLDAAGRLDYERAALLRDGIREIERVTMHATDRPLAVSDLNLIVIVPTSDRYSTVETFFLRAGRLRLQRIVGTNARLDPLYAAIDEVFDAPAQTGAFTDRELDELRLITSWLFSRRDRSAVIHVNGQTRAALYDELARVIRERAPHVEPDPNNEYNQVPMWDETHQQ